MAAPVDLLAWMSLICGLASFHLAVMVLALDKKNSVNRVFFALGILIFLLSLFDFITFSIPKEEYSKAFSYYKRLNLWPLASVFILHFAAEFTGNKKAAKSPLFLIVLYLPAALYAVGILLTGWIVPEIYFGGFRYKFRGFLGDGFTEILVFSWVGILSIAAFAMIVVYALGQKEKLKKTQGVLVAVAVTLPMSTGFVNAFFENAINEASGTLMSFVMIAIIGFAVIKYRLFEINPAIVADNILGTTHSIIIITDENGKIIRVNPTACLALKTKEKDLIGLDFKKLLEGGSIEKVLSYTADKGGGQELEAVLKTGDGGQISVLTAISDILDSAGNVKGSVVSALDITDRKQLEVEIMTAMQEVENVNYMLREKNIEIEDNYNKLKEVDEMKQNFIAIVSHELRTPLTSIMGFLKFMMHGAAGPVTDKQKEFLQSMENSSERLLRLINELLDVSKIESGTFSIDAAHRDVSLTVMEGVKQILPVAQQRRIKIETVIPPYAVTALIDDYRMAQVVINLTNNSLKFSQPDTTITVSLDRLKAGGIKFPSYLRLVPPLPEEFAVITVRDQGIGMSPEHAEKIFERFYQIETPNTRKHAGIGLGLYISRNIVTAHGGYIWAESEGSGTGAAFKVLIPVRH